MDRGESAMDALREAAAKLLRENAAEIAEILCKRAVEGDEGCQEHLCDLAREHLELSKAKRKGAKRSLATEWANEPEWTEEDERRRAWKCGNGA